VLNVLVVFTGPDQVSGKVVLFATAALPVALPVKDSVPLMLVADGLALADDDDDEPQAAAPVSSAAAATASSGLGHMPVI
jgi:hypothetical protein